MSRKDYVAIAAILADERKYAADEEARVVLAAVASRMASLFADDNARFDRNRFLAACGVE